MNRIVSPFALALAGLLLAAVPALSESGSAHESVARLAADHDAPRHVTAPFPPKRPKNLPAFVRGRLVCAANLNRLLAHKGLPGTGSNLAMSFLSWGRATTIKPGAVQVERRRGGGHVRYVSHHDGERWVCLNPSTRHQDWRLTPCSQGRAIGWRAA